MKKTLRYILILSALNSVGQKYFDFSKAEISNTKTFKLKLTSIASPVTYWTSEHEFVFDKSEITTFISYLKRIEKFKHFGFDSLKTAALTTKNDTTQFNNFANAFDNQIVLRFINKLIMQKKIAILSENKQITPNIKRLEVSQDMGGCLWEGYATYIDDKFFFDEVTSQARKF